MQGLLSISFTVFTVNYMIIHFYFQKAIFDSILLFNFFHYIVKYFFL